MKSRILWAQDSFCGADADQWTCGRLVLIFDLSTNPWLPSRCNEIRWYNFIFLVESNCSAVFDLKCVHREPFVFMSVTTTATVATPAGLYVSFLCKKRHLNNEVTVGNFGLMFLTPTAYNLLLVWAKIECWQLMGTSDTMKENNTCEFPWNSFKQLCWYFLSLVLLGLALFLSDKWYYSMQFIIVLDLSYECND